MNRTLTKRVTIGGVETEVLEITTDHDVDRPIATGSLTLTAPRPAHVDLAAPVKIEAGWDGVVQTIFDGRIVDDDTAFSRSGGTVKVALEGWAKLLWYAQPEDVTLAGPAQLDALFSTFCAYRGVPYYYSDTSTNPDGTTLVFGGIAAVNGGNVTVKRRSNPGADLTRMGRHYGYRIFDTPPGVVRQQKISGLPVGDPVHAFAQGVNLLDVRRTRTLTGMFNYNEILGGRYTAADTSEVAVRSFPDPITGDDRLGPFGVNHRPITDPDILTNARADQARNVYEIDGSTPPFRYAWTGTGDPSLIPGEVVSVQSPMIHGTTDTDLYDELLAAAALPMWLMHVGHRITGSGWTTAMEGWLGAGTTFPAGNDCVTTLLLGTQGVHVGNEYLWHYRNPNPNGNQSGLVHLIPFTVAENYSTLTIRCKLHGSNSFVRNQQSTASRYEIWQTVGGVYKSVASGEMPRANEYLERRLPYKPPSLPIHLEDGTTTMNPDYFWQDAVIPLTGSLQAGAADLKIISGRDSDVGDYDDLEVCHVFLVTCGAVEPVVIL